jgi:hypothetical protein
VQVAIRAGCGADAQRVEPGSSARYTGAASLALLPGTGQRMRVTLGANRMPGAIVSFVAGEGVRITSAADGAVLSRSVRDDLVAPGTPLQFMIRVRADTVSVQVDRTVVARAVARVVLDGPWGLRAAPGTAGAWRDVAVVPDGRAP